MITLGGDAELELVDSLDPFSEARLFPLVPDSSAFRDCFWKACHSFDPGFGSLLVLNSDICRWATRVLLHQPCRDWWTLPLLLFCLWLFFFWQEGMRSSSMKTADS